MTSVSDRRSPFLTARALGLATVAAVLIAAMVVLGLWQLGAYDDHQHEDAQSKLNRTPIALADVLGPDDAFPTDGVARPVTVTGHYVPESFEVRGASSLGVPAAVVTPLQATDGSLVLVVRGRGGIDAAPPPPGTVAVRGVLEPSDATGAALGDERVTDGIRTPALVQDFDQDLYAGYVVLTSSTPPDELVPVDPPTPTASRWAGFRNLVYAVQWWVFAGFVAFMWWRVVLETPADDADDADSAEGPEGGDVADDSAAESPRSVG